MLILELLALIPVSTEDELAKLLKAEMKGPARLYVMQRMYGRFSMLRAQRERLELAKAMKS